MQEDPVRTQEWLGRSPQLCHHQALPAHYGMGVHARPEPPGAAEGFWTCPPQCRNQSSSHVPNTCLHLIE